jgi:hypothetical protein
LLQLIRTARLPRCVIVYLEELYPAHFAEDLVEDEEPELGGMIVVSKSVGFFTDRSLPTEPTPVAGSHSTS